MIELEICPKCGKLMYNVNNICPHCNCDIIIFGNPELENIDFKIIYQEHPSIWKYIYFFENNEKVISASTKSDLKDKVLSRGLIWDESKIERLEFEITYQERPYIWKYIYYENNEKKVISARTKPDLKDKVLSRGLIWDESKIKGVSTNNSQLNYKGFPVYRGL